MKSIKTYPNLILMILLALLTLTGCQQDDGPSNGGNQQENIPDTFSEYFGNPVSRNFLGNVIDTDKNPIEGVTITIGSQTATTDENGVFILNNATVKNVLAISKQRKRVTFMDLEV